jgi:hypothetical protein
MLMDDVKRDKIVDRVRKLLALSKSDNPHEAENAAARAQEYIERYRLEAGELEESETKFGVYSDPLFVGKRIADWRVALATAIAEPNGCEVLIWDQDPDENGDYATDLLVAGPKRDCEAVHYLYGYLTKEVERVTRREGVGRDRVWRDSFRSGLITRIRDRLMDAVERARETAQTTTALVLARKEQIEDVRKWLEDELEPEGTEWKKKDVDIDAAWQGHDAGDGIRLPDEGQTAIGQSHRRVGGTK